MEIMCSIVKKDKFQIIRKKTAFKIILKASGLDKIAWREK